LVEIYAKVKFGYLNPILGKLGSDTRSWLIARLKVRSQLSIRVN